ncbi:necrosis inducing protein (NPP1) [Murinocardiopsis flavida]|uniref:Necrosis inducing protein (NPP1) n=1 Tax=Murinocardiopsis flavida TaxID=645275 RepID=A0A2P8DF84_9ACTN|nr:NPP1 family protein [Murinocardiopsis flavida]PSK95869.1 necrosis inducing protein (NPP1) [Murinocardiopsis flavida]
MSAVHNGGADEDDSAAAENARISRSDRQWSANAAGSRRRRRRGFSFAARVLAGAAVLFVALPPAAAHAEPPAAIPASVAEPDGKWQPAFDYDKDGCYPTPAIGPDGTVAEGLAIGGALNGNCRDQSDLDNTNAYARSKCNANGWCAYMYGLYFEKDQTVVGPGGHGHRHDLEHVVVWVRDDQAQYVSASAHGDYDTLPAAEVLWEDTHPKIVYHKDGPGTHAFRFAADHDDEGDGQPENHYGEWQYPDLVSWNNFPEGVRDTFAAADYGSATLDLKDGQFEKALGKAKPGDIEFDPAE